MTAAEMKISLVNQESESLFCSFLTKKNRSVFFLLHISRDSDADIERHGSIASIIK